MVPAGDRWSLLLSTTDTGSPSGGASGSPVVARSREVAFEPQGRGRHLVHVRGRAIAVTRLDPRASAHRRPDVGGAADAASVVSPMPGRVVKLLVSPGDRVVPGQGLVVVEAMKMENEIRARYAATVADVRVREGEPVEARTVLLTFTL